MHGPSSQPPAMPGPPAPRPSSARAWLIVAGAAAALLLIAGAAGALADKQDEKPPGRKASPTAKPTPVQQAETWQYVPAARRDAFVAYLHRLDPGLTPTSPGARPRPLRRAVSTCWDIYDGKPAAMVLHNTAYRYNGGQASVPDGSAKAKKILAAVKKWICSPELRKVYEMRHP